MDDITKEFAIESHECLDQVEQGLLALEKTPGAADVIASIFRGVHTIKGSSGFLGLQKLQAVAHSGESLLSRLRDGKLTANPQITSALLRLVDALRQMVHQIEKTGTDGDDNFPALIAELDRCQQTAGNGAPATAAPAVPAAAPAAPQPAPAAAPLPRPAAAPVAVSPVREPEIEKPAATPAPAPAKAAPPASSDVPAAATASASESNVRVDVGLLDKLMNLVGELVLTRNQVMQLTTNQQDVAFATASQRLNLVTTELQEEIMKTRLQPIGNVWTKFPRVVRDVAGELGKKVKLEMDGAETELDRTIIEAIKDPLTHLVRNAIDHGIEAPNMRTATGKPETGTLSLRAYHEGGQVNIEITDDGRGIDVSKVKAKAVELSLISTEQIGRMGERDALQLIFLPGLSTASKVTKVSGRGVGMDVVKTNIEKIGGSVDIQSQRGHGTTIKIKIPLTLAIIPALMVACAGERYAIPQVSLLELVRLDGESANSRIETVMGTAVYRLRGRLLPIIYLSDALGLPRADAGQDKAANLVVLQADNIQFGLVVDRISDTQEIVVKPLGKHFKSIPVFAGATILGDGKVALIIDVLGLAQHTQVVARLRERQLAEAAKTEAAKQAAAQRLLLFDLGADSRLAIDLGAVGRLEQLPAKSVERVGGREVIQYRGQVMNLLRLEDQLGSAGAAAPAEQMQVVVYNSQGRSIGLVIGHIIDIIEESQIRLEGAGMRPGVRGHAIIQGRVTEVLDLPAIVANSGLNSVEAAA